MALLKQRMGQRRKLRDCNGFLGLGLWGPGQGSLVAPGWLDGLAQPGLGEAVLGQQPANMRAVQIDMRAGAPEPVCALGQEGQGLRIGEQGLGTGLDLLAELVFCGAGGAVAGLGTVPTDETQADALCPAIGQALQLERVPIDSQDIADRGTDAAIAARLAEIVWLGRQVTGAARGEDEGSWDQG